ncbi:hypothetical protein PVAND_003972 [Polypedilum vanderplanki]|uniref:C2H2-type domain-containing protein n=1 Tax=Polypedilum vanderplanki TaxID=319348 RepID=A0A9J6BWA3_POLVA|nr:hypothetical protein PVAND_003972 [Polypedilum vanderplanki]
MKKTGARKQIVCEICKAVLKSQSYYQRHKKTRHPAKPLQYICDYDGKIFTAKSYLRIHMQRHIEEILICNVCCRAYNSKISFRSHLLSHLEKFSCSQCNASFSHKSLLNNHVAAFHMDEMPFKCNFCTRMFANKSARNNHHQTHKNKSELNFKCLECKIFFETKEDLRIHSFIHFKGEIKTCHICDQIFKSTRMLNIHLQKHSNSKFQCETCLEYFVFKNGLRKHIRLNRCKGPPLLIADYKKKDIETDTLNDTKIQEIAKKQLEEISNKEKKVTKKSLNNNEEKLKNFIKDEKSNSSDEQFKENNYDDEDNKSEILKPKRKARFITYTCDKCGESLKFRKNLEAHMKEKHLRNTYGCLYCPSSFKSRCLFKEHTLKIHGVKERIVCEKFECEICGMKFDVRSIYLTHKLSHEDIRKFKCEKCEASFKSVGNLKRHQAIHRESRDFLCDICAKKFKTKPALKIHRKIHADFHVYVNCPYCKTICKENNLKVHIFYQHGEGQEKKFVCNACKKCFKNEFLLKRHYRTIHENATRGITYNCPDCDSSFNRQKDLRMHSFQHYSGQIFPCNECGKQFRNKRLLNNHSLVHAPIKVSCHLCNATFQTIGGRRKHIVRHHKTVENIEFVVNFE